MGVVLKGGKRGTDEAGTSEFGVVRIGCRVSGLRVFSAWCLLRPCSADLV